MSQKSKKRPKFMTASMQYLKVYREGEQIGYGWVFHTDYGTTFPELFTMTGDRLESGWYQLVPDGDERLAVMGETIQ